MPRAVSAMFGPDVAHVRAARRWAGDTVRSWGLDAHADTVVLVVSELATNAMLHAGSAAQVTLTYDASAGTVEVAVDDTAPAPPPSTDGLDAGHRYVAERDLERVDGGRGLLIVSALAHDWGMRDTPEGKQMWLSLQVRPALDDPERLAAVNRLLGLGLDADVLQDFVELARDVLAVDYAQASLRSLTEVMAGSTGSDDPAAAEYRRALTDLTLRTGLGSVPDVQGDPRVRGSVRGIGGYLGVPLLIGDMPVGVLSVDQVAGREWSPAEVAVLQRLARSASAELELRAVSADLALSSTRLEVALGAADVGGFELDPTTGRLWWSDRLLEMFGHDRRSFGGHLDDFSDRVHELDARRVADAVDAVVRHGGEFVEEYRTVLPDGQVRWISARGRRLVTERGVRFVGAAFDSTNVHEWRDRLQGVIEWMTDAYYSLDREWRFTHLNAQAEQVLGRSSSELVGQVLWEVFPQAVGGDYERTMVEAMRGGHPQTIEANRPGPPYGRFEIRTWATPEGLSVVLHDITARHRGAQEQQQALAEARSARERLELLSEMTRALVSTLDVDEALSRLLELLVPRLADWAAVTLVDGDGRRHHSVVTHRDATLVADVERFTTLHTSSADATSRSERVVRTGLPILSNDATDEALGSSWADDELTRLLRRIGSRHLMVVPLTSRDRVLGVIVLSGADGHPPFSQADLETATEVGRRAGLAIDNAQMYGRQRSTAELLQRHLLPPLPVVPGLDITSRYVPAAHEAQVGGDFYWGSATPGGGALVAIGDVAGHDSLATSWQAQLAPLLRGFAHESDDGAASVLSRVDRAMRGLSITTMATVVLARLEPVDGPQPCWRLTWSNAGHPAPVVVHAGGRVTALDRRADLLLGIDPATPRHNHVIELRAGDTLVLYTDGLVERRGSDLDADTARLEQVLGGLADQPLHTLADEVLRALVGGGRPADDVALLAVRLLAAGEHRDGTDQPAQA